MRPRFLMRWNGQRISEKNFRFGRSLPTWILKLARMMVGLHMYGWVSQGSGPPRSDRQGGEWLIQEGRMVQNKRMKGKVVTVEVCWCESSCSASRKCHYQRYPADAHKVHNTDEPEIVLKSEPKPPAQKLTYRRAPCVSHQAISELLDNSWWFSAIICPQKEQGSTEPLFFYSLSRKFCKQVGPRLDAQCSNVIFFLLMLSPAYTYASGNFCSHFLHHNKEKNRSKDQMEKKATFALDIERQKSRRVIRRTAPDTKKIIQSFS